MKKYELEICIDSLDSALEAERLGADRVELCANLEQDGLTPKLELVKQCREAISIGLHVIVRPKPGDFVYAEKEKEKMEQSIEQLVAIGVDGIVSGVLQKDGNIDLTTTKNLIKSSKNCFFTFHRAFDVCKNPLLALQQLEELKVNYLLTSGQKNTAPEGVALLKQMLTTQPRLKIMAGSGVNASNIYDLWNIGIRNFHFTSHQLIQGKNVFDVQKTKQALNILNRL